MTANGIGPIDNVTEHLFSGTPRICMGCFMTPGPDKGMSITVCYRTGQEGAVLILLCPDCHKLRFEGQRGVEISRRQAYDVVKRLEQAARIGNTL